MKKKTQKLCFVENLYAKKTKKIQAQHVRARPNLDPVITSAVGKYALKVTPTATIFVIITQNAKMRHTVTVLHMGGTVSWTIIINLY